MSDEVPILGKNKEAPADQPTPEEVVALLNGAEKPGQPKGPSDLELAVGGQLHVCTHPAEFEIVDKELPFVVTEFRAWGWCPFGVFAIGSWEGDDEELYMVFRGDTVANITLAEEAYEELVQSYLDKSEDQPDQDTPTDLPDSDTPDPEVVDTAESVQADAESVEEDESTSD